MARNMETEVNSLGTNLREIFLGLRVKSRGNLEFILAPPFKSPFESELFLEGEGGYATISLPLE